MRSSIKKLYCTPLLKTYFDFTKTRKIVKANEIINKNLTNSKNKNDLTKFNSYKYMYNGLIKK